MAGDGFGYDQASEYGAVNGGDAPIAQIKKIKIKAPTKMEQSQASGMTMSDVTACKSMIKKLLREKCSLMFRTPVGKYDFLHSKLD